MNGSAVLRVVEKISMTALELGIPLDNVELRGFRRMRGISGRAAVMAHRWGVEGMGRPRLSIECHVPRSESLGALRYIDLNGKISLIRRFGRIVGGVWRFDYPFTQPVLEIIRATKRLLQG